MVAFATDAQIEEGCEEAPESVRAGLRDGSTFLNTTQAHARHLLVTNYRELERKLNAMLTSQCYPFSYEL